MIVSYSKVPGSTKSAHQLVTIDDVDVGDVWREQAQVPDRKGHQTLKWRWFARSTGGHTVLGRGTRAAVILGAGYSGKDRAVDALVSHRAALVGA